MHRYPFEGHRPRSAFPSLRNSRKVLTSVRNKAAQSSPERAQRTRRDQRRRTKSNSSSRKLSSETQDERSCHRSAHHGVRRREDRQVLHRQPSGGRRVRLRRQAPQGSRGVHGPPRRRPPAPPRRRGEGRRYRPRYHQLRGTYPLASPAAPALPAFLGPASARTRRLEPAFFRVGGFRFAAARKRERAMSRACADPRTPTSSSGVTTGRVRRAVPRHAPRTTAPESPPAAN